MDICKRPKREENTAFYESAGDSTGKDFQQSYNREHGVRDCKFPGFYNEFPQLSLGTMYHKKQGLSTCAHSMSLWTKTQQLPQEVLRQIQDVYSHGLPIEVRHYFAQWIEQQPWMEIEEENPQHESVAQELLDGLITILENKCSEFSNDENTFLIRLKFQETVTRFKDLYLNNPMGLVRVFKACLGVEMRLVEQATNTQTNTMQEMDMAHEQQEKNQAIMRKIEGIQRATKATDNDLKDLQLKQESFVIEYQNQLKINALINQYQAEQNSAKKTENLQILEKKKTELEKNLYSAAEVLLQLRLALADKHSQTFQDLESLQKIVIDEELINWKRKQQLAGNGVPFDTGMLDMLQQWSEALADTVWKNRQQILKVEGLRASLPMDVPAGKVDLLPELNQKITGLLSSLVTSTFIVESQPPQVLKKDSRFSATVRLLVGGKLNIHMSPPSVKATIISESLARSLLKNDQKCKSETSGEIVNNTGTMEYHSATGQLSITFRNMQLRKIKRADRKGTEAVTEEKFCILFQSQFTIGGEGELVFQVWTLSLPVVVTVHGNQECNALATVLWDNQFSEPGRVPFVVPEAVPWPKLAEMLNSKFTSMTEGPLTKENLNYLATKIFGGKVTDDFTQATLQWSTFNKDSLQTRNFTFWEWFFSVARITKDHLKGPWKDGSIYGFISKIESQERLLAKQTGTFLLRFSDSETGGITIAWVADDISKPGDRQVWNLAPFTAKDFTIRSLADRIMDLKDLKFLYPDISKDMAFEKYCNQKDKVSKSIEGYINADLRTIIPGMTSHNASPMSTDNPQTPQPLSPISNDSLGHNQMDTIDEMCPQQMNPTLSLDYNPNDIMEGFDIGDIGDYVMTLSKTQDFGQT
ncbi:hypothetical protein ScPMuIL_013176 [Solemya velum]